MWRRSSLRPLLFALAALVPNAGCGGDDWNPTRPLTGIAPDFSLSDVNPNSPTAGLAVSPRQRMGAVSAWYFGHAT